MRIFKFRAWDNKEMHKVSFNNLGVNNHHPNGQLIIRDEMKPFGETYETVLMQHIGLEDKYNCPIYENDIVQFRDLRNPDIPKKIGVVWFKNGSFMIENDVSSHYRWMDYEVEVLGNIYEDLDLVEEYDL